MPVRDYITPTCGLILILFSIYMFHNGIELMNIYRDVASSLLSILIGFVTLSGGVTLVRTWSLARVYSSEKRSSEKDKGSSEKGSGQ